MLVEILTVNLPQDLKPYRMDERWVSYINPQEPGEAMSFPEARRVYLALGDEGHLAFVGDEPTPIEPVPSVLGRRKRK